MFDDLEEALAQRPDAVLVCNPTSLHVETALRAARAGSHLFIEKPLSNSLDGLDALEQLAREKRLTVLMGFNLRFHPGLVLVKKLLEERRIGRLVSIRAQVGQYLPDWHPWEDYRESYSARRQLGGGVILDLIHELDYVRWLAGPVRQVVCFCDRISGLEIETEDTAELLLRFQDGAIGNIHLDYIQRYPTRDCTLIGESGTLIWDASANQVRLYAAGSPDWQVYTLGSFDRNEMFLSEMKHFLSCLEGRENPVCDLACGVEALRLALKAQESSQLATVCSL